MAKLAKVNKPYPEFPLSFHPSGQWCKRIKGKLYYFGTYDDWKKALARYELEREDLFSGKATSKTHGDPDRITVEELVNLFLSAKLHLVENDELSHRTLSDLTGTCGRVLLQLGHNSAVQSLKQEQFTSLRAALAKTRSHLTLTNELVRVKSLFKWGFEHGKIPVQFPLGVWLKTPSKRALRIERNAKPKRLFSALEIRTILAAANPHLRAMVFLGINAGFGNTDCSSLPLSAINLETGWLSYPRPKTGALRRVPLWKETTAAIQDSITVRNTAKSDDAAGCVFVTRFGASFVGRSDTGTQIDSVGLEFGKLLRKLKLKSPGLNFYALRHTFETVSSECRDQVATDLIMGHCEDRNDMSAVYREEVSDSRLQTVAEHVHSWLFPAGTEAKQARIDQQEAERKAKAPNAEKEPKASQKPKVSRKTTKSR